MTHKLKLRRGDEVLVIAGKDKGRKGRIMEVIADKGKVIVEGINIATKAQKANPQKNVQGGLIEKPMPIQASNLMLIDAGGKIGRIKIHKDAASGVKERTVKPSKRKVTR